MAMFYSFFYKIGVFIPPQISYISLFDPFTSLLNQSILSIDIFLKPTEKMLLR